jgi:hypothetical protein
MAFTAYVLSRYIPFIHDVPDAALTSPTRPRFFARLLDALSQSRQRQGEREIGKFTDETSRLTGTQLPGR